MIFSRHITPSIKEALSDSPVVLLQGARQVGKSTLVQWLIKHHHHEAHYLTFDDAATLAAARHDPAGFLASFDGPIALDEVQRVPELFVAIKAEVDRNRQPGRFLLTGSANVLLLPTLSESLAGRMEPIALWPLSQGEIEGTVERFVDLVFDGGPLRPVAAPSSPLALFEMVARGGYPEAVRRPTQRRRSAWFSAYITTILQRDVRDLANIDRLATLPRLLAIVAAQATHLLNLSSLSRSSGIPQSTLRRYLALLEVTYLVRTLPAWSGNLTRRLTKSPKLVLGDTGLLTHLLGFEPAELLGAQDPLVGILIENFVLTELLKQVTWSEIQPQVFFFRTHSGREVDIVLEDRRGRVVAIEVKASSKISNRDFKGIRLFAEELGRRFVRGVLLYTGSETLSFGPKMQAVPISALWQL